jgi:uncharacterized repeat protein (TIGR01451 family)
VRRTLQVAALVALAVAGYAAGSHGGRRSVSITDSPDPAEVDGTLTYELNYTGPGDTVEMSDTLPADVDLVSSDCGQQDPGVLRCTLFRVDEGAVVTRQIVVRPTKAGTITNTVRAEEAGQLVDSDTEKTVVGGLAIAKSASPSPAIANENLTYSLEVVNAGPGAAPSVSVADPLTSSASFVSASASQGTCGTPQGQDRTITCELGELLQGEHATVTIVVRPTQPGAVTNGATVAGRADDPDLADNSATVTTAVHTRADLGVSMTSAPEAVQVRDAITFTIDAKNHGPQSANGVVVDDVLPSALTYQSATTSQGSCDFNPTVQRLRCNLGTLTPEARISLVARANRPGVLTNAATVSGLVQDANSANNSAERTIDVARRTFDEWYRTHCTEPVPQRELKVAFVPVRYPDTSASLAQAQIADRMQYIREYFLQQSMCSVTVTPFVAHDPGAADGYLTLPHGWSGPGGYNPSGASSAAETATATASVWMDGFRLAREKDEEFRARLGDGFDAIFVFQTLDLARSRALSTTGIAANPAVKALVLGLRSGTVLSAAAAAQVLGSMAFVFPFIAPSIMPDLLTIPNIFEQGSIFASDKSDTGTWAHELGHALFNLWDYYGARTDLFSRGDAGYWGLMSLGYKNVPPTPATVFERTRAGWLRYKDVCSSCYGNYPLTPIADLRFGGDALRYETKRNTIGHPVGPVASYIFELRRPPDSVPRAPEQAGKPSDVWQNGKWGVVVYAKRDINRILGVATHHPWCSDALHGSLQSTLDTVLGYDLGSCVDKVNNPNWNGFTLAPGGEFHDDIANVTFALNSDESNPVLSIHGTATSRALVQMATAPAGEEGSAHAMHYPSDSPSTPSADLHVYAPGVGHVGPNYDTGEYELGIPGARGGGIGTSDQWISIPDDVQASFVVNASHGVDEAKAEGHTLRDVAATISVFRYDADGVRGKLQEPMRFTLGADRSATDRVSIPLGSLLGPVVDAAPPLITPPAPVTVKTTEEGGARVSDSPALAAFLAGASATDSVDPFVSPLLPQVGGADVTESTFFPLGTTTVTFRFEDAAGHVGSATADVTVAPPDTVAPVTEATASPVPNAVGWHNTNVTVTLTASDTGWGVQKLTYSTGGPETTVAGSRATIPITSEGATTIMYRAHDVAGNVEAAKQMVIRIDRTAPGITITKPSERTYVQGSNVVADYGCTDTGSGIASCAGPVASGAAVDTASSGARAFKVSASDIAGNEAARSVTYTIVRPVKKQKVVRKVVLCHKGRTIKVPKSAVKKHRKHGDKLGPCKKKKKKKRGRR